MNRLLVEQCFHVGFVCPEHPILGALPDGVVFGEGGVMRVIEIKCPSIEDAIQQDNKFHLECSHTNKCTQLKRSHDYYYQGIGQLAITQAAFCDSVTWTNGDFYIERIYLDISLWSAMVDKLTTFYRGCLGPEILHRLSMM